mmetsp:Transcript_46342/g.109665  ORF Transcript_46342/g.109665 Transcript_46342/m.109665 type:complete len:217 (+) Transcript_46342:388-1038(+)
MQRKPRDLVLVVVEDLERLSRGDAPHACRAVCRGREAQVLRVVEHHAVHAPRVADHRARLGRSAVHQQDAVVGAPDHEHVSVLRVHVKRARLGPIRRRVCCHLAKLLQHSLGCEIRRNVALLPPLGELRRLLRHLVLHRVSDSSSTTLHVHAVASSCCRRGCRSPLDSFLHVCDRLITLLDQLCDNPAGRVVLVESVSELAPHLLQLLPQRIGLGN